jgi:1-acyl-sn-glycerol-3-phosphate acyltransferase
MSRTWRGAEEPVPRALSVGDWLRVLRRGGAILALLAVGFPLLLILRIPEGLIFGLTRPVTPHITQTVCRLSCRVLGLRREMRGAPMTGPGAYVVNHVSWLDIFVLNACKRLYFVAKSEVADWPGIGWLARGTGTVFIARDPRQARAHTRVFEDRLRAGHRLLFFPEGTSTDGRRVLPFRTTLFEAFFSERLRGVLQVQPISLVYRAPAGEDSAFYGWWGDMALGPALLCVLAARRQGSVEVIYHRPLRVADFADRKSLAAAAEADVREGFARAAGG